MPANVGQKRIGTVVAEWRITSHTNVLISVSRTSYYRACVVVAYVDTNIRGVQRSIRGIALREWPMSSRIEWPTTLRMRSICSY